MMGVSLQLSLFLLICGQSALISCETTTEGLIDNPHDPYTDICQLHNGEYFRDTSMSIVCCVNSTLRLPDELVHYQSINQAYAECSQKTSQDDTADFPTAMWKAFVCKLKKSSVFKTEGIIKFAEVMTFITQHYPAEIVTELKSKTGKCSAFDRQKLEDHIKMEKYMECFYEAENQTCHKPYGEGFELFKELELNTTKELGCSVVPGLVYVSSIEYCCKKRTVPYPILDFPGTHLTDEEMDLVHNCQDSFAQRERALVPEAFKAAKPQSDAGHDDDDHHDDHEMDHSHSAWDFLCLTACNVLKTNYTKSVLKLDDAAAINFHTQHLGKAMKADVIKIIKRRKNKEAIFLGMDNMDAEHSKPMTFDELSAKFKKADEKEKIQYYCKFIETIAFEERRALHEYCFDEKYGTEWGDMHHSLFVPHV